MQYNRLIKVLLVCGCLGIVALIAVVIGINIKKDETRPVVKIPSQLAWYMEPGNEAPLIEDNFWRFARASYILIGEIPNCEFYKIASEVPRNDYDLENFYIEDDGSSMYYHDEDGNRLTTLAVDVSEFQQNVDWDSLYQEGVTVAIIRVGFRGYGSGAVVLDEMFEEHVLGAKAAGLKVGVYFYSQAMNYDEGVEEANFVLENIYGMDIDGPVVIDTEDPYSEEARTNGLSNDLRTDGVVAFCDTVKSAGYTPMIYANRNWYAQSLDMTRLGEYKLWLAQYANLPDFPYEYVGWQYTDQGSLWGVDGAVDLNVWFE